MIAVFFFDIPKIMAEAAADGIQNGQIFAVSARLTEQLMQQPVFFIPGTITGSAGTCFGGFVAGRLAGFSHVLHGTAVSIIALVLGLPYMCRFGWFF